jgi:hypothetical protein
MKKFSNYYNKIRNQYKLKEWFSNFFHAQPKSGSNNEKVFSRGPLP